MRLSHYRIQCDSSNRRATIDVMFNDLTLPA